MFPGATAGPRGHEGDSKTRGNARRLLRLVNVIGVVALALNAVGGCGSNKNYDQREAIAATLPDDGHAGIWADEAEGCLGQCQRDPGSPLQDCAAAEAGLEFLNITGWDFEGLVANSLYSYTDKSAHNLQPVGWEPVTAAMTRCFDGLSKKGLHLRGGPFRDWGGGFGVRFELGISVPLETPCSDPELRADYCPPIGTEPPLDTRAFDLTQYDGVSFWARRGPDGQPLLRVMVTDRRTDDDVSFLMSRDVPEAPRFCERNLKCGCPEDLPCTVVPQEILDRIAAGEDLVRNDCFDTWDTSAAPFMICWDPVADPNLTKQARHTTCGNTTCDCPYEAFAETQDPLFVGRGCNEFAFRGGIVNEYCYNPGVDPDPYESNYLCGDHWASPVSLTTDWQFFKVPFTSLLQQGWAKEQHQFDLEYATGLRFTWDKGIVDYYIDDVRLYREQPGN